MRVENINGESILKNQRRSRLMKYRTISRLIITSVICYGVYTETGIWTTIAVALLSISNELVVKLVLLKKHE